jgi:tripartite-type tricarboxylate transporter receptor subunit TctC
MNIKTSNISSSGFFLLLLGVLGGLGGESAFAQTYPVRPIRMIVAYPPGGGTDIVGRMMGQRLGENLGQTVVVDNRGGATGNIGTEIAAHATADGYTLLMGNVAPNAINVSLFKKLPFDPVKDFAPVSLVAVTPNILVVQPSSPVKTVKDLIALAKSKPGTLNFPSAGVGSSSHLAGEMLKSMAGIDMVHVPYKGGGPALVALLSPGAAHVRHIAGRDAAREVGQAAPGRGDDLSPLAGAARIADHRRIRRSGL